MTEIIKNTIIIEIRAGAGGDEAALFAGDLFRMYCRYAQKKGWQVSVLDSHSGEKGGYKKISFQVKGEGVREALCKEGGVHRVQRVPQTEKGNRIHTSTASVAVLPLPSNQELKIKPSDVKMDFFHSSGPGGQNVNKRQTAVRLTHIPTGIVVSSQESRSLKQNKQSAIALLRAKLLERQKQETDKKIQQQRSQQIGSAQRAEKIRTYNFPQDRVTDHRINKSWHNIESILDGELDEIISSLKIR